MKHQVGFSHWSQRISDDSIGWEIVCVLTEWSRSRYLNYFLRDWLDLIGDKLRVTVRSRNALYCKSSRIWRVEKVVECYNWIPYDQSALIYIYAVRVCCWVLWVFRSSIEEPAEFPKEQIGFSCVLSKSSSCPNGFFPDIRHILPQVCWSHWYLLTQVNITCADFLHGLHWVSKWQANPKRDQDEFLAV